MGSGANPSSERKIIPQLHFSKNHRSHISRCKKLAFLISFLNSQHQYSDSLAPEPKILTSQSPSHYSMGHSHILLIKSGKLRKAGSSPAFVHSEKVISTVPWLKRTLYRIQKTQGTMLLMTHFQGVLPSLG